MENTIIHYSTPDEQVHKLLSQNLIIKDEKIASAALLRFGYSNLIKSYREPYIIKSGNKCTYRDGVSFDQIASLFFFDKALRNSVMASMQDLEEHIKETAANVIGRSFGTHQNDYLCYRNYRNKKKRKKQFSLASILKSMQDTLDTDKEPIHHYMEKYKVVPPWILFKSIYFSTIVNYIDQFKLPQRKLMVSYLYDCESLHLSEDALCMLMMDTLFICMDYRNMAAHGGRIYNYESNNLLRVTEIFGEETSVNIHGLNKLLFLLSKFKYKEPYNRLRNTLEAALNRHCNKFPEDVTYLGQILNINITQKNIVWISHNSKKFHTNKYCSGLTNGREKLFEEAIASGYEPCKKCCK